MRIDKDMEQKLTELLVACHVTMSPRNVARALISAGVTIDPNLKHCYQCKHFLDGLDWNLCCDISHPTPKEREEGKLFQFGHLCSKDTNACDAFEQLEEEQ